MKVKILKIYVLFLNKLRLKFSSVHFIDVLA